MAEGTLFRLASEVLTTIASPAFVMAYERVCLTREARDDLRDIVSIIQTIQAVLLDAEQRQEYSPAVKALIKRIRYVLYEAHDLFRDVASNDLIEQQIKGDKSVNKVRVPFNLNLHVSRNPIRKKVKAIRESLLVISADMDALGFIGYVTEEPKEYSMMRGQEAGSFVDSKDVVGRDEDKSAILEMLLHDQSNDVEQDLSVIAIVGIGGIGKTTLAQLVYNDEEVKKAFQNRWFACISDTSDWNEILGKIVQSICMENYSQFTLSQLQASIRVLVRDKNFLLVLDDVWDDDCKRWEDLLCLLSSVAKGCKIIVTTRSFTVARALGASKTHCLKGLSDDESWNLFKRLAFTPEKLNNPRWADLGREIVKKCANVPLAIKSISSILYTKISIQEWKFLKYQLLSNLGETYGNLILHPLKLSYDRLPSFLKQCFAYCSLFPRGYVISKWELIYLWIAQGYIDESHNYHCTVEDLGHSYFMDLLRNSFFEVDAGEVITCKMHDLIHDLAQYVASEECITLDKSSYTIFDSRTRHVSVGYATDYSWAIPEPLLDVNPRICSFLFMKGGSIRRRALDQQFANLKFLHAMSLKQLQIEYVPTVIGELKQLRYLDLSETEIISIPDSITNLLNLLTLDIHGCKKLEALPSGFRKLTNLRHLKNSNCDSLDHMPPGFGKLTSLQHLDEFKVGRATSGLEKSKLDALNGLELSGTLAICFKDDTDDWDGVVECWQPPVNLQGLSIHHYEGVRMPRWANRVPHKLIYLSLSNCSRVNCLPPFGHLPCLEHLSLVNMPGLEYIEEDGDDDEGKQDPTVGVGYNANFFPCLHKLELYELPKLKGWSRKVEREAHSSSTGAPQLFLFPCLSTLHIDDCPELKFMPLCPRLHTLRLKSVNAMVVPQLLSICDSSSTASSSSSSSSAAAAAAASSSSVKSIHISRCDGLMSFPGQSLTSLRTLSIAYCKILKNVGLAPSHLNRLNYLSLWGCPELELWREKKRGVNWDSLVNLYELRLGRVPPSERLPVFLQHRQALGKLTIKGRWD